MKVKKVHLTLEVEEDDSNMSEINIKINTSFLHSILIRNSENPSPLAFIAEKYDDSFIYEFKTNPDNLKIVNDFIDQLAHKLDSDHTNFIFNPLINAGKSANPLNIKNNTVGDNLSTLPTLTPTLSTISQTRSSMTAVPTSSTVKSLESDKSKNLLASKINFSIPNANVSQDYLHIAIEPIDYKIINIKFPENIGISYFSEKKEILGCPKIAGDLEIEVILEDQNKKIHNIKSIFIINPDPRDLWKNIEPPDDENYYKNNFDKKLINQQNIKIIAASRRGRSHEHNGSFRDDDFYISNIENTKWNILLVADGAGSAKNSREGSRIASNSIGEFLKNELQNGLIDLLEKNIEIWDSNISQAVSNIKEPLNTIFKNATSEAIDKIEKEAKNNNSLCKDYSTTLLAAIVKRDLKETFIATFWVGDGAIAAYGPENKIRLMGNPDAGEFAGQTRFLDKNILNDIEFNKRCSIGKFNNITSVILMTDGVSDPYFETDAGLNDELKWKNLWEEVYKNLNHDDPAESLLKWLSFFSPGHHDDRTIALIY